MMSRYAAAAVVSARRLLLQLIGAFTLLPPRSACRYAMRYYVRYHRRVVAITIVDVYYFATYVRLHFAPYVYARCRLPAMPLLLYYMLDTFSRSP